MQGMYQKQQPDAIPTGLKQGGLFGFSMLGIYILYTIVNRVSGFPTGFLELRNVSSTAINYSIAGALALIAAIVFLISGILASGKTGRASSGWVAGHLAD